MPQALDQSGQTVTLSPDEFVSRATSGDVDPIKGARYEVRLADGRLGSVPGEQLHSALKLGATVVPDGTVAANNERREWGGAKGMAIAAASGAGEQATLGLVDHVLPESWRSAIRKSQAQNPISTAVGGAAGAGLLAAATGGVGEALGLGEGLVGGAAGAAERLAAGGLERLAPQLAESAAGRLVQSATAKAAMGAVDGVQYGAARTIADQAIEPEKHQLTAESIISELGADAIWGAGGGAALGALGSVFAGRGGRSAEKAVSELVDGAAAPHAKDVTAVAERVAQAESRGTGLGASVRKWYSRAASLASGAKAEDIEEALTGRAALEEADEIRSGAARDIREHGDQMLKLSRSIQEEGERTLKRGHIATLVEGVDKNAAAGVAANLKDRTVATLQEMLADADTYGGRAPLKNALKIAEGASARIDKAIASGNVADQYALLDDLKKGMGKYTRGASRLSPGSATDELVSLQNKARASKLQELYETLRKGLEDEGTWSKAGTAQKSVNAAWTKQIEASDRFHRALTTEVGRDPENPWVQIRGIDPAKAQNYVTNIVNPSQDLTHKAVTDYLQSTRDLAGAMAESWELPAAKAAQVKQLGESAQKLTDVLERSQKALTASNALDRVKAASGQRNIADAMGVMGVVAGGWHGAVLGEGLGRVAEIFARPAETIERLSRVESIVRRATSKIDGSVRGFLGSKPAEHVSPSLETFERKSAQVRAAATDPSRVQQRIAAAGNWTEQAGGGRPFLPPPSATALAATVSGGLQLLHSKLPVSVPRDPLNPSERLPPPPKFAQEKWLRYYDAVQNPTGVVKDLQSGHLSVEGVEVLQSVYPALFAHTQETMFKELSSGNHGDLTKQQRVALGILLGLPMPETDPSYIQQRQASYAAVAQSVQQDQSAPRKGKPLKLSQPTLAAERVERGNIDQKAA